MLLYLFWLTCWNHYNHIFFFYIENQILVVNRIYNLWYSEWLKTNPHLLDFYPHTFITIALQLLYISCICYHFSCLYYLGMIRICINDNKLFNTFYSLHFITECNLTPIWFPTHQHHNHTANNLFVATFTTHLLLAMKLFYISIAEFVSSLL